MDDRKLLCFSGAVACERALLGSRARKSGCGWLSASWRLRVLSECLLYL